MEIHPCIHTSVHKCTNTCIDTHTDLFRVLGLLLENPVPETRMPPPRDDETLCLEGGGLTTCDGRCCEGCACCCISVAGSPLVVLELCWSQDDGLASAREAEVVPSSLGCVSCSSTPFSFRLDVRTCGERRIIRRLSSHSDKKGELKCVTRECRHPLVQQPPKMQRQILLHSCC